VEAPRGEPTGKKRRGRKQKTEKCFPSLLSSSSGKICDKERC